jgi:hypothetical protein
MSKQARSEREKQLDLLTDEIQRTETLLAGEYGFRVEGAVTLNAEENGCIMFRKVGAKWSLVFIKNGEVQPLVNASAKARLDAVSRMGDLIQELRSTEQSEILVVVEKKRQLREMNERLSDLIAERKRLSENPCA